MNTTERNKIHWDKKNKFFQKNILQGLVPTNGIDARIQFFTEKDFEQVIERVIEFGSGVALYGIEIFDGDEYLDNLVYEEFKNATGPDDETWLRSAFAQLKEVAYKNKAKMQFHYSATYHVPEALLA